MNNVYQKHYLNLKEIYNPEGQEWGTAIKQYCQEYQINEFKLRSYIAKNVGKNKNRSRPRISFSELEKELESNLTTKTIEELEHLLFNLKFLYVEPSIQAVETIKQRQDNSKFEMGEWAAKVVQTTDDYETKNKIKGKYYLEIAHYLNNKDIKSKPNKNLEKLKKTQYLLEFIINYKKEGLDLSPLL